MNTTTHTLESLTKLPDSELDSLAAIRIHGWRETPHFWLYEFNGRWVRWSKKRNYRPTTDRNQSHQLLQAMAVRMWQFWIAIDNDGTCSEVIGSSHGLLLPDVHVPGSSARGEVVAALLASFAMEGK